jgi:hypothetical protein
MNLYKKCGEPHSKELASYKDYFLPIENPIGFWTGCGKTFITDKNREQKPYSFTTI